MKKALLCVALLVALLAGPVFAADAGSIFKSQQDGSGFNVFFDVGYGLDAGAEMVFLKFAIADVIPIDIGGIAWADLDFFYSGMGLGVGAGVSMHLGFNIPFAFVTGEEFRMAYGLAIGLPILGRSSLGLGLGFAYMEDFILYTNFLPANMGIRFGWTSANYASVGGIGLNVKL